MHQTIPAESWYKSTYSASQGDCVEVANVPGLSAVRDTKHRELGALFFSGCEWESFLRTTKGDVG